MPIAGYCHECSEWVYVAVDWSCPKGHAAARVNGWYDTESGMHVTPAPDPAPAKQQAVSASGTRTGFLIDLMSIFAESRPYTAGWGSDTDMTIASNPVDGIWGTGKKRAEYTAALRVAEAERAVYFWEMLKDQSSGMAFGPVESGSYANAGTGRSGAKKAAAVGPGSASWEWGYGTTRTIVEEVAARHGYEVHVVLIRQAAAW